MIKVGSNVKSKVHDDLTGHVVICEPINNYAVIMTDIIEYEMMTILGVPGVIKRKIMICKKSMKSWGSI